MKRKMDSVLYARKVKNEATMFEMCKEILQKVSFDKSLFRKELLKSIGWIKKDEVLALKIWCLATFGHVYKDVIFEAFDQMKVV